MPQNIEKIFQNLKNIEPSVGLEKRILKAISAQGVKSLKRKLMLVQAGLTVSTGVFLGALLVFGKAFLESDFWNLGKLAFSDTGIVAAHMGSYTVSLLETLPVVEMVAMLVPVLALMLMLNWYYKFSNNNFKHVI
jgi:hypothetical protein